VIEDVIGGPFRPSDDGHPDDGPRAVAMSLEPVQPVVAPGLIDPADPFTGIYPPTDPPDPVIADAAPSRLATYLAGLPPVDFMPMLHRQSPSAPSALTSF
jgi:hypothetical protein